jgi:hypothetical protein
MLTELVIPNTWYTIEDTNNRLYMRFVSQNNVVSDEIFSLPTQNYDLLTLRAAIETLLNNQTELTWNITYDGNRGNLTFNVTENVTYYILTDEQLQGHFPWTGRWYDPSNLKSCNDMLRNIGTSLAYSNVSNYISGFVDIVNHHSLYITSNITGLHSIGPRGENNILKKVLTTESYGYLITEAQPNEWDFTVVNRNSLKELSFKLLDIYGNVVNLHGSHISFTLLFRE